MIKYEPFKIIGCIVNYANLVTWNTDADDFQDYWLWQFGHGPFKVVGAYAVRGVPVFLRPLQSGISVDGGYLGDIRMTYEDGYWVEFEVPDACEHFRIESRIKVVMFHSKWLTKVS